MTTRIDVELDDQEVRQRLAVLMRSVTDTLPVMRGIAAELLAETEFAFMDEGPGWPQLSPATVAAREAKGRGPHPILQVTNALARSVTTWADRNEAGIGSNLVYAAIHQFGGDAGRVTRSKFLHGGICRSTKTANWRPALGSPFWRSS
ncbi:phage virion morphogenesis protein [Pseudomonas aeruginosa]|uniref:phage virion morphogenesis protein n=1 Tax=Pseudomonas aeruginosa TaxID=287 RepID=UPI000A7F9D6A|nr:phage virion morphogenesis protein [Pseudomonas aeruginosa]